jgi:mono/diheme cytochrome c family protein
VDNMQKSFMKKSFVNLVFLLSPFVIAPLQAEPSTSVDAKEISGSVLFHDYCSVCHGDRGDGNSRARGSFFPPPRNFTSADSIRELSRSRMIFSATYGRPNTAMAGWGPRLSSKEIERVVDYVRSDIMGLKDNQNRGLAAAMASQRDNLEDKIIQDGEFDPEYMAKPLPHDLEGKAVWGKLFYNDTCADCHGVKGDGNGPRAYFILPKPRDYRHPASRHKYNRPTLFKAIAEGSHGSEMPAWDKVLTYQEIGHVSEYIFDAFIKAD